MAKQAVDLKDLFVRVDFDNAMVNVSFTGPKGLKSGRWQVMAGRKEPWTFEELEAATRLDADGLHRHLRWAVRHDILHRTGPTRWEFHVPLMRRWIRQRN